MNDDVLFLLGVERIHAEHHQIVERVASVDAAVAERHPEDMRMALRFLMGELVEHWTSEERFMADVRYPALGDHHKLHEVIQDRLMEARQTGIGSTTRLATASRALARAVEEHVRNDDRKLAEFVAARERVRALTGESPDSTSSTATSTTAPTSTATPTPTSS